MGFESTEHPGRSPEVEHNPKTRILFFWLERGGRWGSSTSTSPADHQKLNVIQKQEFYFFGWRGVGDGFESIEQPSWSSKIEHNPKTSISFFLTGEGRQTGFKSIDQHGQSSEVEHNPKTRILFFWLERDGRGGTSPLTSPADHQKFEHNPKTSILFLCLERAGRWGLSPLTSPADHQKLNIIQKWAFNFFGWRGVADGVQVHWTARPIIRS